MNKFEYYQKQFSRAVEDTLTDKEIQKKNFADHIATLFSAGEGKFNRTVAMLSMLRSIVPFEMKYDYNTENLPIDPEKYEFRNEKIGSGAENHVYLLDSRDKNLQSWALKIDHLDVGSPKELASRASEIKKEYEEVADWYKELPGLVPKEYPLIIEDPRDGKPAIVTLQQYFGNEIKDIFKLINEKSFFEILEKNPKLKEDMANFIRITEEKEKKLKYSVDLLGPRNLSVINVKGEERLILLDPHLVNALHRSEASRKEKQKIRLEDMKKAIGYDEEQREQKEAA